MSWKTRTGEFMIYHLEISSTVLRFDANPANPVIQSRMSKKILHSLCCLNSKRMSCLNIQLEDDWKNCPSTWRDYYYWIASRNAMTEIGFNLQQVAVKSVINVILGLMLYILRILQLVFILLSYLPTTCVWFFLILKST